MEKTYYTDLLKTTRREEDLKETWDSRAAEFFGYSMEPKNSRAMNFLLSKIDIRGKSILDIGCGAGRFLVPFVQRGAVVTGIDISDKMLASAAKVAEHHGLKEDDYRLVNASWDAFTPEDGGYDLVFASMSPGISDWPSIQKALNCAREGLYISSFADRKDELFDRLLPYFPNAKGMDWAGRFRSMVQLLLIEGYFPDISFHKKTNTSQIDPVDTSRRYTQRLNNGQMDELIRCRVERKIREEMEKNGEFNTVERVVGMMYIGLKPEV